MQGWFTLYPEILVVPDVLSHTRVRLLHSAKRYSGLDLLLNESTHLPCGEGVVCQCVPLCFPLHPIALPVTALGTMYNPLEGPAKRVPYLHPVAKDRQRFQACCCAGEGQRLAISSSRSTCTNGDKGAGQAEWSALLPPSPRCGTEP